MKVGLIPLDERPVNTRYPQMIGQIGGVEVLIPPTDILSNFRTPADCDTLAEWLNEVIDDLDARIVSIDMLVYGGLIPSRITDELTVTLLQRLEILRDLKHSHPHLLLFAFNLITRVSSNPDSIEEPHYWHESGEQLYRFSQAFDRYVRADGDMPDHSDIPEEHLYDLVRRRKRNHMVNLAVLDLLADDVLDLLIIGSDASGEYGFATHEQAWVKEWVDRRGGDERLLMYPGADEVGSVLLARSIVESHHALPRFYVHYAVDEDKHRIAPFEDVPVLQTVERQIEAVGGVQVDSVDGTDLIVAVNPPAPSDSAHSDDYRQETLNTFVAQIKAWLDDGQHVIVCDVAYPNGSDPLLIETLRDDLNLTALSAYCGWNTAGNTIGIALAQGIASNIMEDETAEIRFLIRRFVEDYCYMYLVRQAVSSDTINTILDETMIPPLTEEIENQLNQQLQQFADFSIWRVSNVHMTWNRLFEVDFDLEQT